MTEGFDGDFKDADAASDAVPVCKHLLILQDNGLNTL